MIKNTPSKTAGAAAIVRALAQKSDLAKNIIHDPYAVYFAKGHMLPAFLFNTIILGRGSDEKWTRGMLSVGFMFPLCRHRYFNDTLLKSVSEGYTQIVLLGAGYDTSPLRFSRELAQCKIFEIDFPSTQNRKLKKYSSIRITVPDNITFISYDLNSGGFMQILSDNEFDFNSPTLFIAEGLISYLHHNGISRMLYEIKKCRSIVRFVMDYRFKTFLQNRTGKIIKRWKKKFYNQGENYITFFTMKEAEHLFNKYGFKVYSNINTADIWRKYTNRIPVPNDLLNISAIITGEKRQDIYE